MVDQPKRERSISLPQMDLNYSEWISQKQQAEKDSEEPCSKRRTTCWMGGLFSLAQWQELELQDLIYRYMMAGASVPLDLILHLKRTPPCYYHYQPSMMQAGCWGRCLVDAEPGRCRRTDGKKWRCSRDVVAGQKYCERHVHRGRNRSRKHVEIPTPSSSTISADLQEKKATHFPSTSLDITPHDNQRHPDAKTTDSRVLMRFFDDWPRSQQEDPNANAQSDGSDSHRSVSITGNNPSSEFSLTLSTGNNNGDVDIGRQQPIMGSWLGWGNQGEASMGGPLAEALRSPASAAPSPTSVLQKHINAPVSETSSATA